MPKRSRKHQIEDISRAKFQLLLPANWVFRDKHIDYGIDGEVEIFDKNDHATGIVFWVQLKATDATSNYNILNIDFKIKTLQYYNKISIPVLLVRYSVKNDAFYSKWSSEVDLFYSKENAKTYKVKFNEKELWNPNNSNEIELQLIKLINYKAGRFQLPISISLDIIDEQVKSIPRGILLTTIRNEFKKYTSLTKIAIHKDQILFNVILSNELLVVGFPSTVGCIFHNIALRDDETFIEDLVLDILLGIACNLSSYGHYEFSNNMISFTRTLQIRVIEKQDIFIQLFNQIIHSNHFISFMQIILLIMNEEKYSDEFAFFVQSALLLSDKHYSDEEFQVIENFYLILNKRAIESGDKEFVGSTYYNLGSHYRTREKYKLAASYYIKAKRFCHRYLKQDYYFKELGGIYWFLKKYSISAKLYEKGLEINYDLDNLPLYADALMFSGKYETAYEIFEKYFAGCEEVRSEWILKHFFLFHIINDRKTISQNRKKIHLTIDLNEIDELEKKLEEDMLNNEVWYKLGLIYEKEFNVEEAYRSYIHCALIQNNDIESWIHATICAFSQEIPVQLFIHTVSTAYYFNRDYYLEGLYTTIHDNNLPNLDKFVTLIDTIIKQEKDPPKLPQFRLPNEEGLFEDILKDLPSDSL